MLLVERLLLVCFWVVSYVGPGPNVYCVVRACSPVGTIRHHVPQSSVSSVRAEDITRLKSAWMSAASDIVCVPRTLLGTQIVTTVHLLLFLPFDERELDHHCSIFNIPVELRLELPDQNSTTKDSPEGKIGTHTRFIEFANYRVPLSKFLLCILEYYQIHLSLLSVIGTAKVSHFEIICRTLGRIPTIDTFRRFYVNSIINGWLSFSKRGGGGTSVVKDPLPVDEAVDLPCVELLNENRTLIRKYHGTFLCFVGLSRSFTDTDVRPTLLHDNDEEMGLLEFVKSADPFKVKVEERTLAENEVPLITKTEDRVISPSAQTVSLVDHNIQDELNVNSGKRKKRVAFPRPRTAGKSPTALRRLIRQGEQADAGSGSAAAATEDITSSSVTPTLEHALEDALHDNVRTRPPTSRFVVLFSSSADTGIPAASQVVPHVYSSPAGVSVLTAESASDGHPASTPEFETGTLFVTPSHGSSADDFYESQTVDSATAMNVDAEVADLKVKLERLESKAAEVDELHKHVSYLEALVAVKSGEVAGLTTHNAGLLERVSVMESEHDSLKSQVVGEGKMREEFVMQQDAAEWRFAKRAAELNTRITDMRHDMDNDLYPHMLTAIAGRRWVVGHGFRLAVYKCARSVECRSTLGKVISMAINKGIQQGLEAGIVHGKAGRSLTQVEAYDPKVEGKYVAAVSKFEGVSFPLLDELESLKDSPLVQIMSALILKDDQGNRDAALEFARFQPFIDQVDVPVYSESGSIEREMLLSDAIPAICQSAERRGLCLPSSSTLGEDSGSVPLVTSLGVTDYQVSTLVLVSDGGPTNQPPVTQPHDDLFDTSVLDKPSDV
ncbi:hypothetical protein Tco_1491260 [Tanacetum coccineum]